MRARAEVLKRIEWRAERECQRWAQRSQVTVDIGPDLAEHLRAGRERLRELQGRTIDAVAQQVVHQDRDLETRDTMSNPDASEDVSR